MKKYLVFLFFMLAPLMGHAQGSSIPATNYLAGAVPEVDGRVAFSKDFFVEGYSQQDFYDKLQGWLTDKLYELKDPASPLYIQIVQKAFLLLFARNGLSFHQLRWNWTERAFIINFLLIVEKTSVLFG